MIALPAHEDLTVCGDCGKRGAIMFPLRKPGGWWAVCSVCMRRSMRDAADDRERAARRLAKLERKTHNRERPGSHQDEAPIEIFEWSEAG